MTEEQPDPAGRQWDRVADLLGDAVRELGGLGPGERATDDLLVAWDRLCAADLELASRLWRGLDELTGVLARTEQADGPAQHAERSRNEMLGLADIGLVAEAFRSSTALTLPDLVALGKKTVRDEIERDTEPGSDGSSGPAEG